MTNKAGEIGESDDVMEKARGGRRGWRIGAGVVVIAGLLILVAVIFVGRLLSIEDPLKPARAIVVLSGRIPARALEAAEIYHQGFAKEIWLTKPVEPGASLENLGIHFDGEEVYNRRVLEKQGVPAEAIRVLEPGIINTADEIVAIRGALAGSGGTVIIVTTQAHTRRVRALWARLAGGDARAIVRGASGDGFDPAHWWRTSGDALDVVRETLGLLNVWAGLPLRGTAQ